MLIQEQKQIQEHTTAEFGLLRGELNNQITRISVVEEFKSNKIAEVEKSVTSMEKGMPTKIEDSIANIKDQIMSEVKQFMKTQLKQISEQTVPMIKTCLLYTSRCV